MGEVGCADALVTGGKAAALSRLAEAASVPPGFTLSAALQRRGVDREQLDQLVGEAYAELGRKVGTASPAVAVRSSGIDEDGTASSFAGQHETFLNIRGDKAVTDAVLACWESARAERVASYRAARGLDPDAAMAVLVQQLVVADEAGVAFTADPVTFDPGVIVVNASFGLGESIVSGTVTPDTYRILRHSLEIVERRIAPKALMTVAGTHGVVEVAVPSLLQREPALTEAQVLAVAELALRLESCLGAPADIEYAFGDGRLHLLQCRPITTMARG